MQRTYVIAAILVYLSMSIVCVAAYWFDKQRAVSGGRRVPESTLHILTFLGGWPGAIFAQWQFRHKTKKLSFLIKFWLLIAVHLAIVGALVYFFVWPGGER